MFRSSKMTRTLAAGLLAVGLVGGAACSSDDSEGGAEKTTTTIETDTTTDTGDTGSDTSSPGDVDPTEPGSEGPSDNEQDYIDGLAEAISDGTLITAEQGTCLGESWVDMIGFDTITATGMSPSQFANLETAGYDELDLSDAEAGALYDAFGSCDIDVAETIRSGFQQGATPEQQACLDGALTEEAVKGVFTQGLMGGSEDTDAIQTAVNDCLAG